MSKVLSAAERADRERRRARRNRIASIVVFALAALFVIGGIVIVSITGSPRALITTAAGLMMAVSGFSLQMTAGKQDDTARIYDWIARGGY